MSVDKTIVELTRTLEQLGTLVEQINGQISGITEKINGTLNELDNAITGITTEAKTLTGQIGDAISQIPNSWVFYLLFITLIVVFILLAVLILMNLLTKSYYIYKLLKGKETYEEDNKKRYKEEVYSGQTTPLSEDKTSGHISLPINFEDGSNRNLHNRKFNTPNQRQINIIPGTPYDSSSNMYNNNHDSGIMKSNFQDVNIPRRTYLRKGEETNSNIGVGARYNVSTGTTVPYYNSNTNLSTTNHPPILTSRAEQV
uniref:Uncharacterized protein n=1 Tax=Parastrongyloides trichosuri TaxID=131310 RepID=A0A0N4ZA42_PARTI